MGFFGNFFGQHFGNFWGAVGSDATTEVPGSGDASDRRDDDFSLSYTNARKRREAEEQEAMAAFAVFMMSTE